MSFIQPCFIRKNTPELREKLEELEYKQVKQEVYYNHIMVENGNIWSCNNIFNPGKLDGKGYDKCIDCGENEDLFLALAALRDDSDYMQWFCDHRQGNFTLCLDENNPKHLPRGKYGMATGKGLLHKATVEELIEHFKK